MTIPSFGHTTASDAMTPRVFESLESVPDDQVRLLVRCAHPRRSPTRIAKVAGGVIRTQYGETNYPGAPQEWVEMDCEGCQHYWLVSKGRIRLVIDSGVREIVVSELTDEGPKRLERLPRPSS